RPGAVSLTGVPRSGPYPARPADRPPPAPPRPGRLLPGAGPPVGWGGARALAVRAVTQSARECSSALFFSSGYGRESRCELGQDGWWLGRRETLGNRPAMWPS